MTQIDRAELHARLDQMLDSADPGTGVLDLDSFWEFVAALGQGRGITDTLHDEGLAATKEISLRTKGETRATLEMRAYHIALLTQLLLNMDRAGGASILPGNFNAGLVAHDLHNMLQGKNGMGLGKPRLLFSGRITGDEDIWRAARTTDKTWTFPPRIVCFVMISRPI